MRMSGSCLCGAIRYEISAAPVIAGNCHCKDCQRSSGSAYAPTFFVPEQAITIRGDVTYYSSPGGSGGPVKRGFCGTCGSQMFGKPSTMAGLIAVRAGTLDDASQYQPQVDIFVSHAAPWDYIAPNATTFPTSPPRPPQA